MLNKLYTIINKLYIVVNNLCTRVNNYNKLYIIINRFYIVITNLCKTLNKLFTKKNIFINSFKKGFEIKSNPKSGIFWDKTHEIYVFVLILAHNFFKYIVLALELY